MGLTAVLSWVSLCTELFNYLQGLTKRCRLSWLTNSALVYEPKCGGGGELRGISQWVQLSNGNASETKANESFDNDVFFNIEVKRTPSLVSKLFF